MITYKIEEATAFKARRQPTLVQANNLTQAKRKASQLQAFFGTVLHVYSETGELLAHKTPYCAGVSAKWHNH